VRLEGWPLKGKREKWEKADHFRGTYSIGRKGGGRNAGRRTRETLRLS